MKVDHIGYLTKDLDACAQALAQLGFKRLTPDIRDDVPDGRGRSRNVQLCFMENGGTVVELVSPLGEDSDVYNRLKTNGEGPYNICFAAEVELVSPLGEDSDVYNRRKTNGEGRITSVLRRRIWRRRWRP